jgi:hypothetical protein
MAGGTVIRRVLGLAAFFAVLVLGPAAAVENELRFDPLFCAKPGSEIVIEGSVETAEPVTLVLRIDDEASSNYATRVNLERLVPSGPFAWRMPVDGLRESNGEPLNICGIKFMTLFVGAGDGALLLDRFEFRRTAPRPANVLAFDLGPENAPQFPGFLEMTVTHPALSGASLKAIRRPGPDALIADGITGISALHFDLPKGEWKVTLWTEDPGEWETLPHPFRRTITLNGQVLLDEDQSPQEWFSTRYLVGKRRAYHSGETPWQALGRYRGGVLSGNISTDENGLDIKLSGDMPAAGFLSAIVIEPANGQFAADAEARRERDFNEIWRILPSEGPAAAQVAEDHLTPVTLTSGTGAAFTFSLDANRFPKGARLSAAGNPADGISLQLWQAEPHLVRAQSGGAGLQVSDRFLIAVPPRGVELQPGVQRFTGWVSAGSDVGPGQHRLPLAVTLPGSSQSLNLMVDVINVRLPEPEKPSGFYLDEAPHLAWGANPAQARTRQLRCDLNFLGSLGIFGNSPALSTPSIDGGGQFGADAELMRSLGTALPALAYAPAKRLFASMPPAQFPLALLREDSRIQIGGQPSLVWSLTDEPSNAEMSDDSLLSAAPQLKSVRPGIRLAGHFNRKGDERFAEWLDTILVNPGFGVDAPDLRALGPDKEIWLYNMERPRLAAGLFLHFSRARRYVQWHARMPTADPFDPTDGREDDFQMFLPSLESCPAVPDINEDMLDMAEGLTDQRWLQWLGAQTDARARNLASKWRAFARSGWARLSTQDAAPKLFRAEVTGMARLLKGIP